MRWYAPVVAVVTTRLAVEFRLRKSYEAPWVHTCGVSCYGSAMICMACGDVIRITGWTQLTLDETHELWFTLAECLCGVEIMQARAVEDVHAS